MIEPVFSCTGGHREEINGMFSGGGGGGGGGGGVK